MAYRIAGQGRETKVSLVCRKQWTWEGGMTKLVWSVCWKLLRCRQLDMGIRMGCRRVSWLILFPDYPASSRKGCRPCSVLIAWVVCWPCYYSLTREKLGSPTVFRNHCPRGSAYITLYEITWTKMPCNLYLIRKHLMSDCLYTRENRYQIQSSTAGPIPGHCSAGWYSTTQFHSVTAVGEAQQMRLLAIKPDGLGLTPGAHVVTQRAPTPHPVLGPPHEGHGTCIFIHTHWHTK